MKEFIKKWSNWWILSPQRKQLDEAFEKELNELVEQEVELHKTDVRGSVFLIYNQNGHVIAVCSSYDKAEEIFRSEFGEFNPEVGIEEFMLNVKHCHNM